LRKPDAGSTLPPIKTLISNLCVAALALAISTSATAAEKKKRDANAPRTLTGVGICGKCSLGETKECTNVLQVTRKGRDGKEDQVINYLIADNDTSKDAHKKFFCKGETPVSVTGTVARDGKGKDAKSTITASKIEAPAKKKKKKDA
jgi:hypothetical protein